MQGEPVQPDDASEAGAPVQRAQKVDPWAHRRGEPRVFTLLWSMYLLIAALMTVFSVRFFGVSDTGMFHPAARALLTLTAIGVGVLWPMVRLSQVSPERPRHAALVDVLAVGVPAQAVIWPSMLLTRWSWTLTAGLAMLLFSWSLLVSAIIAAGTARRTGMERTGWMAVCLVLVAGVPAGLMVGALAGVTPPVEAWLASPLTAVYALTVAPSGLSPQMHAPQWAAVALPGAMGLAAWAWLALARGSRRGPGPALG